MKERVNMCCKEWSVHIIVNHGLPPQKKKIVFACQMVPCLHIKHVHVISAKRVDSFSEFLIFHWGYVRIFNRVGRNLSLWTLTFLFMPICALRASSSLAKVTYPKPLDLFLALFSTISAGKVKWCMPKMRIIIWKVFGL